MDVDEVLAQAERDIATARDILDRPASETSDDEVDLAERLLADAQASQRDVETRLRGGA